MSLAPLYLYPTSKDEADDLEAMALAEEAAQYGITRRANLSAGFVKAFSEKLKLGYVEDGKGDLKKTVGPEDFFHYMYGVFHSPGYRERYAEFLKMDFPRVPLTGNKQLFRDLCKLGARLVELHLMKASFKKSPGYPVKGSDEVDKPRYDAEHGRVYINDAQYFDGVPERVWEYHVGGYQVCQKWLKDRKGRKLEYADLEHYPYIVAAIGETIDLMEKVDQCIEKHGGWPIV
jgi:predicted helicase